MLPLVATLKRGSRLKGRERMGGLEEFREATTLTRPVNQRSDAAPPPAASDSEDFFRTLLDELDRARRDDPEHRYYRLLG